MERACSCTNSTTDSMAPTKRPGTPSVTMRAARYINQPVRIAVSTDQKTVSQLITVKSINLSCALPRLFRLVR